MSAVRRRTRLVLVLAVAGEAISGGDAASSVKMLSGSSSPSTSTQGKLRRTVLQVEEDNANGNAAKGGLIAGGARGPFVQEQALKIGDAEERDEDNVNVHDEHGGSASISQQQEQEAAQPGSSGEASSAKSFLAKTSLLRQQAGHQLQERGPSESDKNSPPGPPPAGGSLASPASYQPASPPNPVAAPLTPPAEKLWSSKAGKWVAKKWVAKEYPALGTEIHQLVQTTPDEGSTQEEIPDEVKTEINDVVMNEVIMNRERPDDSEIIPAVTEDLLVVDTMLANTLQALFPDWTLPDPEFQAVVQEANQEGNEHLEEEPLLGQAIEYMAHQVDWNLPGSRLSSYMKQLIPLFDKSPEPRSRLLAILLDAARACRADFPFKRTSPSELREVVIAAKKRGGLGDTAGWHVKKLAAGIGTPAELELQQAEESFPTYVRCLANSMNRVLRPTIGAVTRNDQMSPASSPEDDRAARDICDKNQLEATWFHDWNLWPLPEGREEGTPAQEPSESGALAPRPLKSGTLDALKQDIFSHVKLAKVLEKWDSVEEFQRAMERDEPLMFQSGWNMTKMPTKDQDAEGNNKKEKNKIDLEHLAQDTYDLLTSRRYVDDFCTMPWGRDDLGDARILPKTMRVRWANIAGWMRYAAALGYAPGVLQITDMLMSVVQTGHGQARPLALCSDQPDSFLSDEELLAMKAYVAMECVNYSTSTGHISEFIQALLDMRKAWRTAVPNDPGADPNTADRARAIANAQCATTYAAAKRQLQTSDDQKFKQARGDAQERVQAVRNREAKKWLLAEMFAKGDGEPRMDRLSYPAKRYVETKQRCMVPAALAFAAVMDACRHLEPCGPLPGIKLQRDGTFPDAMQYVTAAMQDLLASTPFEKHGVPGPVLFTGQKLPYLTTERMRQDWTIVHLALSCPEDVQHRNGDGRTRGQLSREMMEAFVMKAVVDAMRGEFVTYMLTYCGFHEMRVDMDATHGGNKLPAAEHGLYPMEALEDQDIKDLGEIDKNIIADKFKMFYGFDEAVWNEDYHQVCKKNLGSVALRAHVGGALVAGSGEGEAAFIELEGEAPPKTNQTTTERDAKGHLAYREEDIPTSISFDRNKDLLLKYAHPGWHGHEKKAERAYCAARCENINADASAATTISSETLYRKPYCEAFTLEYNTEDGSGKDGVSCHFCHIDEMEAHDFELEDVVRAAGNSTKRDNKSSRTFRRMPIAGLDRDLVRRGVLDLAYYTARHEDEAYADDGKRNVSEFSEFLEEHADLNSLWRNAVAKEIFPKARGALAAAFEQKAGLNAVAFLTQQIAALGPAGRARVQDARRTSRVKYMSVFEAIGLMAQRIYQIDGHGDEEDENAAEDGGQGQREASASSGRKKHKKGNKKSKVDDRSGKLDSAYLKGRRLADLPLSQRVMTYHSMQIPQFIRAPDEEAKIVWEVLADHPSACAIEMCNQGDCLERPIDEVFGKALGGVGTCVARYANDNDSTHGRASNTSAGGEGQGQPAKYPVFMFQPLVPQAPENAERATPDTEEEEEAMMDALPEDGGNNTKNTTKEAAGDEQEGASSSFTSRPKMVHPPVATGRCLQHHQVLWEIDDLPKAHTKTKQLSPFSCQRHCESNKDCAKWVAWTEWRTSRKQPAWGWGAWLVCKNVMKAGMLQGDAATPSNRTSEEGEEPPADGAEKTLRIIARNTLQGAVCDDWDKNSPENLSPLAKPGPKSGRFDSENGETTEEARSSGNGSGKAWLSNHSLIIFMLLLAIVLGGGVAIYLYVEQSRRQEKIRKRAARRAKLKKKGFSQPQVARMLQQADQAEAQGKGQAVQVLFQEDKQALEKLLQKDGGAAAGKKQDVRGLMEVMDAMDHEYTREEYRDAMLRLQFSAGYAEEIGTQIMILPAKATDGDEGTLARIATPPAGADAEKFAELECPETLLAFREFLRLKIAERQMQAEEQIEQAGGDAAVAADRQLLPYGSLEDDSGIAVNDPYSTLNEDEMNQMIREGTLPDPRSSRMSIPGRTSQAPRGSQLQTRLSARLSGTASAGASTSAAATTLTPEEEEKAKKLRETRQKNKERDVKKMLKNNITEALADAYGNLINGDDKKARNLPLPLPASDEEMRAVREIMGAEEGEEIAPSVNQFRDALRKGAKK